ncbi:hypothetical protein [Bifidobacterium aerophilum]|uniref:Cobalt transporter n=1 Tax=Bifidobacterium aerophilum TaxID=1798155 RepID=A0A6N9Z6T3_9BIFI|nr:hypothetical protein [Bifidobacterium aerophilum]NEG89835.1 hypothetical protein [Bifidobacterium aerophilum]
MNISKRTIVMTAIGVALVGGLLVASTIWSSQRFEPHDAVQEKTNATTETRPADRSNTIVGGGKAAGDAAALPDDLCGTTAVEAVKAYVSGDRGLLGALFSPDADGLDVEPGSRSSSVKSAWLANAGSDTASCLVLTDDATWAVGFMSRDDGWMADSIVAYSGTVSMPSGVKR